MEKKKKKHLIYSYEDTAGPNLRKYFHGAVRKRTSWLTLVMLNKLRYHTHFQLSATQITWSRLLIQIHILNDKQCRSRSFGFWRKPTDLDLQFAMAGHILVQKDRGKKTITIFKIYRDTKCMKHIFSFQIWQTNRGEVITKKKYQAELKTIFENYSRTDFWDPDKKSTMSLGGELDVLKEIPGYKAILKSVIKTQIQLLVSFCITSDKVIFVTIIFVPIPSHLSSYSQQCTCMLLNIIKKAVTQLLPASP